MKFFLKCLVCQTIVFCWFAMAVGCDHPTYEKGHELVEIKKLFEASKIRVPDGTSFVSWCIERGYINAILRSANPFVPVSSKCSELKKVNSQLLFDEMKARSGEKDFGVLVQGSAGECEWDDENDRWRATHLQTSKGFIVQLEVFKNKSATK